MKVEVGLSQVLRLAPAAGADYRKAIENGQPVLDCYGIPANPLRVAHFMAQVLHETGGLKIRSENLNYSAARLPVVWPSRFKPRGLLDPRDFANNPARLANEVYGGRMGNTGPNDGFTYRGRGMLQLTGRDSYRMATLHLRRTDPAAPDFVATPDEVVGPQWCLAIAACEWTEKGCNRFADQDDIVKVTRAINGGLIGLQDRKDWLGRTRTVWA